MNQGSVRTIILSTEIISTSYRFISLQTFKVAEIFFSNTPVTVAPLAMHLPASYTN